MKNNIFVWGAGAAVLAAAIVASGFLFTKEACHDFKEARIQINGQEYKVALADNEVEKTRGLIGCDSVPSKSGMYFKYDTLKDVQYWMKGMSIPIDIVWIANGTVVGIEPSVPPQDKLVVDPPRYRPIVPVNGVLEIGAGKAAEYGIAKGSTINLLP